MVAPLGADRFRLKVSSGSTAVSPLIVTLKVLLVLPAAMVWPESASAT